MLTNADSVRAEGNFPSDLPDQKLWPAMDHAETRLRQMVGAELYETVQAETSASSQDRRGKLSRAEACLAVSFALPVLNIRANSNEGGLVSSIGFADTKNSLLSQDEIDKLVSRFEKRAMEIISEFVVIDDNSESFGNGLAFIAV